MQSLSGGEVRQRRKRLRRFHESQFNTDLLNQFRMAISLACKRNPYILWGVAHRSSSSYSRPLGQSIHSRRKTQRLNRTFLLPPSLAVPFLLATTFSPAAQTPPFAT